MTTHLHIRSKTVKYSEHPLIRNRNARDLALACAHALESADMEIMDARSYADGVDSDTAIEAIDETYLSLKRAREMLEITIKGLPE